MGGPKPKLVGLQVAPPSVLLIMVAAPSPYKVVGVTGSIAKALTETPVDPMTAQFAPASVLLNTRPPVSAA